MEMGFWVGGTTLVLRETFVLSNLCTYLHMKHYAMFFSQKKYCTRMPVHQNPMDDYHCKHQCQRLNLWTYDILTKLCWTHVDDVREVGASENSQARTAMGTLMQILWGKWKLGPDLCTKSCIRGQIRADTIREQWLKWDGSAFRLVWDCLQHNMHRQTNQQTNERLWL